ncbi:Processing alpha glucosidase I [Boothiomyces sp. JEL0866]|nr:Processing alpha glucosidase I [Boothiomyces sp. JEL0866]
MKILNLVCLIAVIECSYNDSMYWINRPNLYFGTRTRTPETLLNGLLWFGVNEIGERAWENVRHTCEQDDTLSGYAWNKHNGLNYGSQIIKDSRYNVAIKTEFVKVAGLDAADISLLYYLGLDGNDGELKVASEDSDSVTVVGDATYLKNFKFLVKDIGNNHPGSDKINIANYKVEGDKVWQVKDLIVSNIVQVAQRINNLNISPAELFKMDDPGATNPNLIVVQHMLSAPFVVEYALITQDNSGEAYFGKSLSQLLQVYESNFDSEFEKVFRLAENGYDESQILFGKMLLGNMLGGLGYFYGSGIVDNSPEIEEDLENSDYFGGDNDDEVTEIYGPALTDPYQLFTGVPSRPFFPRGFLWDSGFDQLLISEFNTDISMDIMNHWANLIDENGWVAREQILGDEARSKVPKEFQTQYTYYANPPTMVGGLRKILDIMKRPFTISKHLVKLDPDGSQNSKTDGFKFLHEVYPKFKLQYEWFKLTQQGEYSEWSTIAHSGDMHLDLLSWMIWFSKTLKEIAVELDLASDVKKYEAEQSKMLKVLNELHWDDKSKRFCDVSFKTNGEFYHVQHPGYISILPLALGLLPADSNKFGKTLDLIHNSNELWSPYGLCSLSKSDELFGQGENYWRGPIWVNINYLVLQSLYQNYIHVPGPYQQKATKIYSELRNNLINNVYDQYLKTGYVWEQYSCLDGVGQRSRPFTGWTSLVLLAMSEKY